VSIPSVEEITARIDRSIREAVQHVRTGEGDQAAVDDLLERRRDVAALREFALIVYGGEQ